MSAEVRGAATIAKKGTRQIDVGLTQVKASGEKFGELATIARENSAIVRQISTAVRQQNSGITQISDAITEQNDTMKRLEATKGDVRAVSDVSQTRVQIVERFRF